MDNRFYDSSKTMKLMKRRCLSNSKTKKHLKRLLKQNPYKYFSRKEILSNKITSKCDKSELQKLKNKVLSNPAQNSASESDLELIRQLRHHVVRSLGRKNINKQKSIFKKSNSKYLDFEGYYFDSILTKNTKINYPSYKLHQDCRVFELLDIDDLARGFEHFRVKNVDYNQSKSRISFCVDIVGDRNYYFIIKDLIQNKIEVIDLSNKHERFISVHDTLSRSETNFRQMSENYIWIDDESIIYIAYDTYYNVNKCYTYNINSKKRRLIYSDKRNRMLSLSSTDNGNQYNVDMNYIILYSSSYNDDEVFVIDILENKLFTNMKKVQLISKPVLKCSPFVRYDYINHIDGRWFIMKQDGAKYSMLSTDDFKTFKTLFIINGKYDVVKSVDYYLSKFVILIKNKGNYKIKVYDICTKKLYDTVFQNKKHCPCVIKNSCDINIMPSWIDTTKLLLKSTSFTNPGKIFYLNLGILGNEKSYLSEVNDKLLLPSRSSINKNDKSYHEKTVYLKNNTIMCTLIYKKGMKLKNEKCVLYGYGSYGDSFNATYNFIKNTELCDKGFVVVIAHISGDNAMGHQQYLNGIYFKKHNTFEDFIYIAENYLFKNKITSREKLAIWGRSAGGLLISSVINMKPDICKLAIMGVPFLTPILTMSSKRNPLGFESHSEWGDPRDPKVEKYIKTYSPIDNIQQCAKYPNILIYANMNDTLTPFKETMMYHEKMKNVSVFESGERDLLVHIDEKYGHVQGSSKTEANNVYAVIFSALDKYIK